MLKEPDSDMLRYLKKEGLLRQILHSDDRSEASDRRRSELSGRDGGASMRSIAVSRDSNFNWDKRPSQRSQRDGDSPENDLAAQDGRGRMGAETGAWSGPETGAGRGAETRAESGTGTGAQGGKALAEMDLSDFFSALEGDSELSDGNEAAESPGFSEPPSPAAPFSDEGSGRDRATAVDGPVRSWSPKGRAPTARSSEPKTAGWGKPYSDRRKSNEEFDYDFGSGSGSGLGYDEYKSMSDVGQRDRSRGKDRDRERPAFTSDKSDQDFDRSVDRQTAPTNGMN